MKVRYTPDVFRFQQAGGVSRYFVELATGLRQLGVDARIIGGLHINQILAGSADGSGLEVGGLRPPRARQAITKAVDHGISAGLLELSSGTTVIHPTWYPPGLARLPRRSPVVVTVFDMIPERFPAEAVGAAKVSARKREWVARSNHVVAISESAKTDLINLFDVDPNQVTVTYLGVTRAMPVPFAGSPELHKGPPFLLYVGDRRPPYKNFARLLEALADPVVPVELRLVCMGSSLEPGESDLIARLGLGGRVLVESGPDSTLAWLYSHAQALVYPSLYEGFGLPPLEAMAHGCPVVAADAGAIPEIVGDAALLVDPLDTAALAKGVAAALEEPMRTSLVERGHARSARFTWAETTARTLEVYQRLSEGP